VIGETRTTSRPVGIEMYSIKLIKQARKKMEDRHTVSRAVGIEVSSVDRII
jgi:hypothetical protein